MEDDMEITLEPDDAGNASPDRNAVRSLHTLSNPTRTAQTEALRDALASTQARRRETEGDIMDTEMQRDFNDAWRTVRTEYPDLPAAAPCDSDYLQQIFTDIMDLMADVAKNTASATKLPTRPASFETPLQPWLPPVHLRHRLRRSRKHGQ